MYLDVCMYLDQAEGRYCTVSNGEGQMAWIEEGGKSMQRVRQWRGGRCGPLADQVPSLDWTS